MAQVLFSEMWNAVARDRGLLPNSVDSYWWWTKRFFAFTRRRASEWTGRDWEGFERWLIAKRYSYSARRQARSAVNFIFREVLKMDVGKLDLPHLPKPPRALVVVPTREEIGRLFTGLHFPFRLPAALMYGSGPRVEEVCRIRVQDLDLEGGQLRIWDGKGEKNRVTVLPLRLVPSLRTYLDWRAELHARDVRSGGGVVELPDRLGRKFRGADRELGWQWLFPSRQRHGAMRWYLAPDKVGAAIRTARREARMVKRITCHSLRKAFATHLMQAGMPVVTIQAMLGHASLETTQVYLANDIRQAFSPLDLPAERLVHPATIERGSGLEFLLKEAA